MDHAGTDADGDAQALLADGDTAIGTDFEGGAQAPDVRPPRTTRCRTQSTVSFALGGFGGGVRSAAQFPDHNSDFAPVAVVL